MDELDAALERLSRRFRERCGREGQELHRLVEAGRSADPRVRQLVHGLAGAGGTFGFPDVSALARRAETAIDAGGPAAPELTALLASLQAVADLPVLA